MKRCKDVGNFPRSPPHLYGQTQKNMKDRSLLFSAFFSITMALFAQQPLTPVAVSATEEDRTNIVDNLFDGDLNTRWSANLDPVYATIDLGEVKRFAEVRIAYYKGDQRRAYFDLQRSDDGINWTDIRTGFQSSGTTLEPELFPFEAQEARYLRYVGRGNSASDWSSLTEMTILGGDATSRGDVLHVPIASTASDQDRTNGPANLYDGRLDTRWAAFGNPQYAVLDLGSKKPVHKIKIAFSKGDLRNAYFDIQASDNGTDWTDWDTGMASSGTSLALEQFVLPLRETRYLRYMGRGNSLNEWNSLQELEIYGPGPGNETIHVPVSVDAPIKDRGNIGDNMFDGDLGTRWSAFANPATATIDLGSPKSFNELRIAYYKGDTRQAYFDLQRSDDGSTWTTFATGMASSGTTLGFEPYPFSRQTARYLRYVGRGNSLNDWNSITEMQIIDFDNGEGPGPGTAKVTELVFLFDAAGNQIVRRPPETATALKAKLPPVAATEEGPETVDEPDPFDDGIVLLPNPTKGELAVTWAAEHDGLIEDITVTDLAGKQIPIAKGTDGSRASVDLRDRPTGVYLITFRLKSGRTVGKKIIKD